jgi:hypothetical protein
MKKTIRLTEADLSKLIRRVIKEIDGDIPQEIMSCATEVLTLTDMAALPTCLELGMEVITNGKIPTDLMKGFKCVSELVRLNKKPEDAVKFFTCVANKISNPVMNASLKENKRRINVK